VGSLLEHTKDHADGSPNGGPHKPHHVTGHYPGRRFGVAHTTAVVWLAEIGLFADAAPQM